MTPRQSIPGSREERAFLARNKPFRTQEERELEEGLARKSARWNSALDAGYRPEDYGYDKDGRKTDAYTGYRIDPNKAVKDAASKQRRETARVAEQRAQAAAPPRVSMIDGRPAHEVLKEGRARLESEGLEGFGPTKQERATEALYNSRTAAKAPAKAPATSLLPIDELVVGGIRGSYSKPAAPAAPAAPADPTKPASGSDEARAAALKEIEANEKYNTASAGNDAGLSAATAMEKAPGVALSAAALAGLPGAVLDKRTALATKAFNKAMPAYGKAVRMKDTAEHAARRVGSIERGVARITNSVTPRAIDTAADAARAASKARTAELFASRSIDPAARAARTSAARSAYVLDRNAKNVEHFARRSAQQAGVHANRLVTARAAAAELSDEAAKAISKSGKLAAVSDKALGRTTNTSARILGKLAPSAKLGGRALSKVAVPLQVALMLKEGYDLLDDEKRAEKMADFEATATNPDGSMLGNSLRSAGKGALNPVTGIYHTGHQLNEWSKSSREAERAAAGLRAADARFAARQAAMAKDGITKESLRAMPRRERSAILRRYRAINPN